MKPTTKRALIFGLLVLGFIAFISSSRHIGGSQGSNTVASSSPRIEISGPVQKLQPTRPTPDIIFSSSDIPLKFHVVAFSSVPSGNNAFRKPAEQRYDLIDSRPAPAVDLRDLQ